MTHFRYPVLLASALIAGPALATPLDKEACDGLKAEYARLGDESMKADLAKGAEWGKANLSESRLTEIKHYIETEEQFLFRCPQPKPVVVPGTPEVDGVPVTAGEDREADAPADETPNSSPGHVPDGTQPTKTKPKAKAAVGTGTKPPDVKKADAKASAPAKPTEAATAEKKPAAPAAPRAE